MRRFFLVILCLAAACASARAQKTDPLPNESGYYLPMLGVTQPHLLHAVPAAYPDDAKLAQTRHACVVSAVVGADGTVKAVDVDNAQPSPFDQSAMKAVSQSTFSPGTLKGRAVPVQIQLYVIFRGDGNPALPSTDHGGSFQNPRPTFHPNPEYTKEARKARLMGEVLVSFVVMEDGSTTDIRVIRPLGGGLDEQTVKTIRQWQFEPATLEGEAVPDRISTMVSFRLQ